MKKLFIFIFMALAFIGSLNAVTVINSCPASWVDGETYQVSNLFPSSTCAITGNDIIIEPTDGTYRDISLGFVQGVATNFEVRNFNIKSLPVNMYYLGEGQEIIFRNNTVHNSGNILSFSLTGTSTTSNVTFIDNFFQSTSGVAYFGSFYTAFQNYYYRTIPKVTIIDSVFLNFNAMLHGRNNNGALSRIRIEDMHLENSILDFTAYGDYYSTSATCDTFESDSYVTFLFDVDANKDKIGDSPSVLGGATCQYVNKFALLEKEFYNPITQRPAKIKNYIRGGSDYFEFGFDYYLARGQTLGVTDYIDLTALLYSNIYLMDDFTTTAVNTIRAGTKNKLIGFSELQTDNTLATTGTITAVFDGVNPEAGNWAIISYVSSFEIDNLDINLIGVGNYGLIKKTEITNGNNLKITNSDIFVDFVPSVNIEIPTFFTGALTHFENNILEYYNIADYDRRAFVGGKQSGLVGGNVFINNVFEGGAYLFQDVASGTGEFANIWVHNSFEKGNIAYSYPFDLIAPSIHTAPELQGAFHYKTTCDSYEFNLGNYYRDVYDNTGFNDTNIDGISDEAILRGVDFLSNNVYDSRALISYPYDFVTNIGNAVSTTNLCGTLIFNIVNPTETNYSSGYDLTTSWSYTSASYADLYCYESLNGEINLYENVDSGDSNGLDYTTSDGTGIFQVTCCDTPQCDNVVKESELIEFQIGSLTDPLIITGIAVPPVDVYGCMDILADNYNALATISDGSCTYAGSVCGNGIIEAGETCDDSNTVSGDGCSNTCQTETTGGTGSGQGVDMGTNDFGLNILSGDITDTSEGFLGFFQIVETPLGYALILGVVFVVIVSIGFLFAILRYMIS